MESESRQPSPARLLAPVALVIFAVALLLVLSSGGGSGGGDGQGGGANAAEKRDLGNGSSDRKQRKKKTSKSPAKGVYVVKQGDTLGGIAETTGVPVERLQELNPGLDQFSLVAGQRIKLR